jgi:hypothetical protein
LQNLPGIALRVPHDVIIGFIKVYRMMTNIMIIYLIKIRCSACSSFLICRSVGYEQSPIANENGACDTTKVLLKCFYATSNRIGRKQVITVFASATSYFNQIDDHDICHHSVHLDKTNDNIMRYT